MIYPAIHVGLHLHVCFNKLIYLLTSASLGYAYRSTCEEITTLCHISVFKSIQLSCFSTDDRFPFLNRDTGKSLIQTYGNTTAALFRAGTIHSLSLNLVQARKRYRRNFIELRFLNIRVICYLLNTLTSIRIFV